MNRNTHSTDPVCGMTVNDREITAEFQGAHYAFCSEQCQQRFQENPHLYIGFPGSEAPRHAGVEIIKTRTLKLAEPLPRDMADKVIDAIGAMMGVQHVDVYGDCIEISYDLLQATEEQIEQAIEDAGVELGNSLAEKIKRAFIHYIEETEAVTLEARPGSVRAHHH